jgi:hypothetical protein
MIDLWRLKLSLEKDQSKERDPAKKRDLSKEEITSKTSQPVDKIKS